MMLTSAPAKIILFGEHAVVYGQPAIAAPVSSLRAYASIEPSDLGFRIIAQDLNVIYTLNDRLAPLVMMAQSVLDTLNVSTAPDVNIKITSHIPIAGGMGSGAAIATVLGRAVAEAVGLPIDDALLNGLVYETEKTYHGTPSGIDNTVVVYEKLVYFVRGQSIETLTPGKPFIILIADSGQAAFTREIVGDVRKLYETQTGTIKPIVDEIGYVAKQARYALETGNILKLGRLMQQNHNLLTRLTVSSDKLDRIVHAANGAGALGAKLSGAGRGGNVIALVDANKVKDVSHAMIAAGAVRVLCTQI